MIIGVDTGGTFTDIVFRKDGGWKVYKILSTPEDPAKAVIEGIEKVSGDVEKEFVVHGTTVATNTILERKGSLTAIITNRGFEDIIEIGRQNRKKLYDLSYRRPQCLVSPENRFGVKGRIDCSGKEIEPIDIDEIKSVISEIKKRGIESVAVCLLFSYANPEHEITIGRILSKEGLFFSLSHRIVSEFREYERFSTAVLNAYVGPRMKSYIRNLKERLGSQLRIMQSNGGIISAEIAMDQPVRTIFSGPAGGVVGAYEIAKKAGFRRIISFDMGGTSTDVSLIDGKIRITAQSEISGIPVKVPMIDIHSVGSGGGSTVRLDPGGALRVGPESAGADPGPICYGKGEKITVTDANLFLGRLIPEYFLGGEMKIYRERIEKYFYDLSKKAGLRPSELAEGIIAVANSNMQRAIRRISVERGYDPRRFVLFSFGGAAGLHACELARLLSIPLVIIPENPGLFSAIGMLMADIIKDHSFTVMKGEDQIDEDELIRMFKKIESEAVSEVKKQSKRVYIERYLDMRYEGQSYEIIVPFRRDFIEQFHKAHKRLYGYRKDDKVQIVNLRVRVRGKTEKPKIREYRIFEEKIPERAFFDERKVIFNGKEYCCPVLKRSELLPGNRIDGPAIIVEYSSTVFIPPDSEAKIDRFRNILIQTWKK